MKKIGMTLFLSFFLLLCLLPLGAMAILGPSQAAANEILAQPPALTTADGGWNLDVLQQASDYFADHFAGRQELITVNARLEALVFHESASEDVLLGKDGWLYYASTLPDYEGTGVLTQRQLWAIGHTLSMVQEYTEARGASLLFTVVPNKNSLYPEYMPDRYPATEQPGNLELLDRTLQAEGVPYLNLYEVLSQEEAVLYHKTDSHWTNLGAALAHDAIEKMLGREDADAYRPEAFTARQDHTGDLYTMLYPTGTETEVQYYPNDGWDYTYTQPIRSPEDQMIHTTCEGKTGKLLMFRDSFGNTLHSFMADSFSSACFSRAMPYDMTLLDRENADTLVIEIVERNIPWLAERAPIMEAPERTVVLPDAQIQTEANCDCEDANNGLFRFHGEILTRMDTDSPVYLLVDEKVYEATPVGETANSFTAYLPASANQLRLLYLQDGKLTLSQLIAVELG